MRVLLLGGTTEASELARELATDPNFSVTLSLAGRTLHPKSQPLVTRIGGFGGVAGLACWLQAERIAAVVDATHPYASQISAHAVAACAHIGVPLATLVRPPWDPCDGDIWLIVANAAAAASALGPTPRRVFLSLGRLELAAFSGAPHHDYLARTIDAPADIALPPHIRFIFDRGPFRLNDELHLLQKERIDTLVSKNSGGSATYAKIAAARTLGLAVTMIERPDKATGYVVENPAAALTWLRSLAKSAAHCSAGHDPPPMSRRGV